MAAAAILAVAVLILGGVPFTIATGNTHLVQVRLRRNKPPARWAQSRNPEDRRDANPASS